MSREKSSTSNVRTPNAVIVAITAVVFYLVLALLVAGFYDFNLSCLLHLGEDFGFRKEDPKRFPGYATTEYFHPGTVIYKDTYGYDGAYYYILARDPLALKDDAVPLFKSDKRSFMRYQRVLFPLVVYLLSLGQPRFFPLAMFIVNLCAIGASVFLIGEMLKARGVNEWLSLVFGLNVGLIFAFAYDTVAPLAYLFVVAALFFYEKDRLLSSTICFSLSLLTWESSVLFLGPVILYELTMLFCNRSSWLKRRLKVEPSRCGFSPPRWYGFALLSMSVIPFLVCQYYFSVRLGAQMFGGSSNVLTFPFGGMATTFATFSLEGGLVALLRKLLIAPFACFVVACVLLGSLTFWRSKDLYALMLLLQASFALFTYEDHWSTFLNATRVNAGMFLPLVLSCKPKRFTSSDGGLPESWRKYFFAASVAFSALAVFRVLYDAKCPYFPLQ